MPESRGNRIDLGDELAWHHVSHVHGIPVALQEALGSVGLHG